MQEAPHGERCRHPGGTAGQELRHDDGPGGPEPCRAPGQRVRPARAERSREDDLRPGLQHVAAARRGPRRGAGLRRGLRGRAGPRADRPDRAVRGPGRLPVRPGQPDHDRRAGPAVGPRGQTAGRRPGGAGGAGAEPKRRPDAVWGRSGPPWPAGRAVKTYSGGMRRRLDLAASLIGRPEVLFLDEPTTGLDPRSRSIMWDIIRELAADGTTLLLTTQYLDEADQLAGQIVVVDAGRVIAAGTPDELKARAGDDRLVLVLPASADRAAAQ